MRNLAGWSARKGGGDPFSSDERILGDPDFVDSMLAEAEENLTRPWELGRTGFDLEKLKERVAQIYQIDGAQLFSQGRQGQRVRARDLFCIWAVRDLGFSLTELARLLGMSPPGMGYAVQRGEAIARENGYRLTG